MIKRTNAGERRQRIEIQASTQGEDSFGTPVEAWVTFARPWAARLAHSGRVFFQAQQMRAETSEIFNIRYISGVTVQMRVIADGKAYQILDVDDREGRHVELDLHCRAVV